MPTITVSLDHGMYVADFARTDEADEIRALFGTTILPMPFTMRADRERVLQQTRERNPGCRVVFVQSEQGFA